MRQKIKSQALKGTGNISLRPTQKIWSGETLTHGSTDEGARIGKGVSLAASVLRHGASQEAAINVLVQQHGFSQDVAKQMVDVAFARNKETSDESPAP